MTPGCLRSICPFCHHPIPVRLRGPWPLQRHDNNGHAIAYIGRPGFKICPGSRAVLPLFANPWAYLALAKEHPVELTLFREVEAQRITPGDVIDYDGPIAIETVEHHLSGIRLLGRRRPTSRRSPVECKPQELLRVMPTGKQEAEAWQFLIDAASEARSSWLAEQQKDLSEPDSALPAAPWELHRAGYGSLGIVLGLSEGAFMLSHRDLTIKDPPSDDADLEPIATDG